MSSFNEQRSEIAKSLSEAWDAGYLRGVSECEEKYVRPLRSELAAERTRREEAEEIIHKLELAWDRSWDCSRDPGHPTMALAFSLLSEYELKYPAQAPTDTSEDGAGPEVDNTNASKGE